MASKKRFYVQKRQQGKWRNYKPRWARRYTFPWKRANKIADNQEKRIGEGNVRVRFDRRSRPRKPLVFRSRKWWGAKSPRRSPTRRNWTNGHTITFIHHTVSRNPKTAWGRKREQRWLQRFHRDDRGWNDIGYNAVVYANGEVFEGRGEEIGGAHTSGYNSHCGIALAGNYDKQKPTRAQIDAVHALRRKWGIEKGPMMAHGDVYPTACPGKKAEAAFKL